jgi:hypothetical protein
MNVTVMFREGWIRHTLDIEISDKCPVCGGKRGKPYGYNFYDDGDWFWVNRWDNPCGHLDKYADCIKESLKAVRYV